MQKTGTIHHLCNPSGVNCFLAAGMAAFFSAFVFWMPCSSGNLVYQPKPASLVVQVNGLKSAKGQLLVALFAGEKGFPDKARFAYRTVRVPAKSEFTLDEIPPGTYSLAIVHDENQNNVLDKNLLGIPKEGYGFSSVTGQKLMRPDYRKSMFQVSESDPKIGIQMSYW